MTALQTLFYHLTTLFLFTKSDIKTTLIPVTVFAIVAAPVKDISRVPHVVFWIWLHLLQFNVSNQTLSPEEDAHNKVDRPLPSGRITLPNALVLRWALIPTCFLLSIAYSVQTLYASVALVTFTIIYDELHAHAAHWAVRNIINAAGFASFEWGATLVAGASRSHLDDAGVLAVWLSAGIFASTIHTQDFKDIEGDRLVGRRTLPIVSPNHARKTVLAGLWSWSLLLVAAWNVYAITATVFLSLATLVGGRFLLLKSVADDQVSFYIYNVWLSFAHALPGYWRYMRA
ncbi:UbiA prenyltransferase family [Amylostereum chailletii]|nr:UbiA prenyltransferase family [Amylostereum chailletii]